MKRRRKRDELAEWHSAAAEIRPTPVAPRRGTPVEPDPLPEPEESVPFARLVEEIAELRATVDRLTVRLDKLEAAKPKPRKTTAKRAPAKSTSPLRRKSASRASQTDTAPESSPESPAKP